MTATRWVSPLRYPGGKVRMTRWLAAIFDSQWTPMDVEVWMEPFAGGAGAGLMALDQGLTRDLWLVEANPALAAFWQTVVDEGQWLASEVEHLSPTLSTYQDAQETVAAASGPTGPGRRQMALAALVLNRCSRSGIVAPNVGPIGGKTQSGRWTVGSRFNALALAERIRRVASLPGLVVHAADGIDFLEELPGSGLEHEVFAFVDPPYIGVGNRLYTHGMDRDGHERLADALRSIPSPWLLTYDAHPDVLGLYPGHRVLEFEMPHTAGTGRIGTEYAVLSEDLNLPDDTNPVGRGEAWWVATGTGARHTA